MPKLPVLAGRDIVSALERPGFDQVRQRGSHVVMRPGSRGTVVLLHKDVKTGTLAGIPRQAELTQDEFFKAIK